VVAMNREALITSKGLFVLMAFPPLYRLFDAMSNPTVYTEFNLVVAGNYGLTLLETFFVWLLIMFVKDNFSSNEAHRKSITSLVEAKFDALLTNTQCCHADLFGTYIVPHYPPEEFVPKIKKYITNKTDPTVGFSIDYPTNIAQYADLAADFLTVSTQSVLSTNFFSTQEFTKALSTNDELRNWLIDVHEKKYVTRNNKSNNKTDSSHTEVHLRGILNDDNSLKSKHNFKNFEIVRVHIVNSKAQEGLFIKELARQQHELYIDMYMKIYAKNATQYRTYCIDPDSTFITFFGEYIIFDKKVLIQFNPVLEITTILIGPIVKFYSDKFSQHSDNQFSIKSYYELESKVLEAKNMLASEFSEVKID
jgi:hypothetical protein